MSSTNSQSPNNTPAAADERLFRRSWIAALLSVPYLAAYTWYVAGATRSALGQWPAWPKHEIGYYPDEGLGGAVAGLVILSVWCIPLPIVALIAAFSACWDGFRVARRRQAALYWTIPAVVVALAAIGITAWAGS